MSRLLFHIGGIGVPDSLMIDYAEKQARKNPKFEVDMHISFDSAEKFFATLTPGRVKILEHVHANGSIRSVKALASELGRDYANVHRDVDILTEAGLLHKHGTLLSLYVNDDEVVEATVE
jgi:predicted transcriptional regulator